MCSQKHKSMVEDLHFIFGLQPDLATITSHNGHWRDLTCGYQPLGYVPLQWHYLVHYVLHFEECPLAVIVNCEFMFWELHGTFPTLIVAGLNLP
jgi:hypothetical protein